MISALSSLSVHEPAVIIDWSSAEISGGGFGKYARGEA